MVTQTLHRSAEPSLQQLLNQQRCPSAAAAAQYCDVLIQLRAQQTPSTATTSSPEQPIVVVAANFCVLAAHSTFLSDRYFATGSVPFSIHKPLTIELIGGAAVQCADCLLKAIDFVYDEPVELQLDGGHAEHLREVASRLGLRELLHVVEDALKVADDAVTVDDAEPDEIVFEDADADDAMEEIVLHFDEAPDKLQSRTGSFQYKAPNTNPSCKKHTCPGCPFTAYKPPEMLFHLRTCSTPNTTCNLCDRTFATRTEFRDHLPRHNNPTKPFYCNHCEQRFVTKAALAQHTPKHSPVPLHQCTECDKSFKWKHGLRNHYHVTHAAHAQHLCDECGFSTAHLETFRAHQLGHTGAAYRCTAPQCAYKSRRKENLRTHLATHRNEAPFVCEVCGHRFSQNKNLKRHALLHVARDLFRCPHCVFSSSRKDKLKEHIGRQHTERPLRLELSENDVQSELLRAVEEEVKGIESGVEVKAATTAEWRRRRGAKGNGRDGKGTTAAAKSGMRGAGNFVAIAPKPT